jgi:hypothetical protein
LDYFPDESQAVHSIDQPEAVVVWLQAAKL